mgnify:CR=1 FL=1
MNIKNFDDKEVEIIYTKVPPQYNAEGLCDDPDKYKRPLIIVSMLISSPILLFFYVF